MNMLMATFFRNRVGGRAATATAVARVLAGLVFVLTSIPKFPFAGRLYEVELEQFVVFGFPDSSLILILVGLVELGGGLMLILGIGTRLAAVGLAVNMVGAIATAGVRVGGIHLVVAPTLLAIMLFLLWAGPGAAALDRRLATRLGLSD